MAIVYLFIFIFGLATGSFINCLIWRLHEKKTILGRSMCPKCKKKIAWYDNIPVLSFIILGGKCRHCHKSISIQYPLVELVTGVLFVAVFLVNFQFLIFQTVINWIFISILIIIFIYDFKWYLILDIITIPAIIFAFLANLFLGYYWFNLLLASVVGGGFFLLQFIFTKGRGIGGGDIRLGILMGAMLGWPHILTALMLAYISGSIIGIILLATKKKELSSKVPFGTFLSVATVITLLWGDEILSWYFKLLISILNY